MLTIYVYLLVWMCVFPTYPYHGYVTYEKSVVMKRVNTTELLTFSVRLRISWKGTHQSCI